MALIAVKPTKKQRQREALISFAKKMRLEIRLKFALTKHFGRVGARIERRIKAGLTPPDAREFAKNLKNILTVHCSKTAKEFSDPVAGLRIQKSMERELETKQQTDELPDKEANKERPVGLIAATGAILAPLLTRRVSASTSQISTTTQAEIAKSIARAREQLTAEARKDPATGQIIKRVSKGALAVRARGLFVKGARSRAAAIATTETQAPAEAAKQAARLAIIANAAVDTSDVSIKTWATLGDNVVRDSHIEADSQQRRIDEPFDVGSSQLMFPGDTSLGAGPEEIANCRCSAPPTFFKVS